MRLANPSRDHYIINMNAKKVTLCWVPIRPSVPCGHTILTMERNREEAERQERRKTRKEKTSLEQLWG